MYVDAALHRVAIPPVGAATMAPDPRPLLAITIGDPAGIGPEVVLKALRHPRADCKMVDGMAGFVDAPWVFP